MTDENPILKPKSKRRRWVIVGALLFVLSVAGWWFWPREDSRFVGKWAAQADGSAEPESVYEFSSLGSGTVGQNTFLWNVEGDNLVFGVPRIQPDSMMFSAYLMGRQLSRAVFGTQRSVNDDATAIIQVGEEMFIIDDETYGEPTKRLTFRRIR